MRAGAVSTVNGYHVIGGQGSSKTYGLATGNRPSRPAAPTSESCRRRWSTRQWGGVVYACSAVFAAYGSMVPFNFVDWDLETAWRWIRDVPASFSFATGRADFFSNVCLFVPLGVGGMAWLSRNERSAFAVVSMMAVLTLNGVLSLVIESAQTMLPTRIASHADLVAQLIGGVLGCLIWMACGPNVRRWLSRLQSSQGGGQRLELVLQGYLALQFCLSVFPLDVTIHPGDLYHKLQRGRIRLIPFVGYEWNGELIQEMLFYGFTSIPYGALATRLWVKSRTELRNVGDSLALGMAMVIGIEFSQLMVASRFTDATQVVMGAGGVLVGVLLMHAVWPRSSASSAGKRTWMQGPGIWLFAAMLYAFIPAAFLLWPYHFEFDSSKVLHELRSMLRMPFAQLLSRSPLHMSTIMTRDLLLYLPLGALLGAGIGRTSGSVRMWLMVISAAAMVSIALGIEILQTLAPDRQADLTEVLLANVAGFCGMFALGFRSRSGAPEEARA